jgi:lipopolysaccharide transport system permease protein
MAADRWRQVIYVRDLARELVVRDLKRRYKRSALGVVWSLLGPLAQMLVLTFVFHRVVPLDIPNYRVFVFCGILVWAWFQSSLQLASGSITDNRELVRCPNFPVAVLPAVSVATNLVHFVLALPVLFAFLLVGGGSLSAALLALPLVIALQFAFTLGLAYIVAALQVSFRDTQHLLGVGLMLLFYLSPVFYDASAVPPAYQAVYRANPMVPLIGAYRGLLLPGPAFDAAPLLVLSMVAGALLWAGHDAFRRASHRFVEEL